MKRGYEAHILGEAPHHYSDPVDALKQLKVCPAEALHAAVMHLFIQDTDD